MNVKVVTRILEANDRIALENRKLFDSAGVFVINLMSGPGAGKTSLLEKTLAGNTTLKIGVIEGDIAGTDDAERVQKFGAPVVQINTGGACHLDANMIREVLADLPLDDIDMLFIENVGNLVCPAEFQVGEDMKVMILSIAEGHDKPLKCSEQDGPCPLHRRGCRQDTERRTFPQSPAQDFRGILQDRPGHCGMERLAQGKGEEELT
jgi:hydrogenase nickel incorporation protein HypB